MKKEQIQQLFVQFENACYTYEGIECWSARDLQTILGYSQWKNFLNVIDKAKKACENAGAPIADHFADIGKMIELAKGAQRKIEDIALTAMLVILLHKMATRENRKLLSPKRILQFKHASRKL
jgi:DNA-damage-inducible protein D